MDIMGVKMHGRKDDDSDFVLFNLERDVNFIEPWQMTDNSAKTLAFHTPCGSYVAVHLMRDAKYAYKDYGFESYDRSTIVNLKRIDSIEGSETGSVVYFVDGSYVNVRKKFKN
ncbi:LytTR family transcriptional regulator DNA-binding domain-containing protein [Paenibacillus xylanexedens]|uniref:LytTR family transcriptional regulator DNA-binding domain-containing protein n=1 Tax=Paenibacillus xylanexedens TaxID=528191 RepID=UPI00164271D8|nr:LytTR family transcriptional regulator DNA-binding domain-containing protein [Paenibacillus xylanexedens]